MVIEKAKKHSPELILLDMKMPEMDGYETTAMMKSHEDLQNIPIIAVTASAMKKDEERISKLCDYYLKKPINKADLMSALIKFLPCTVKEASFVQNTSEMAAEADMVPPPAAEMDMLYELALSGDMRGVQKFAAYIEKIDRIYRPFSIKLSELAGNFEDDRILKFIEKYMEDKK